MIRAMVCMACLMAVSVCLGGCGSTGSLSVRSAELNNPTTITGDFNTAIYAVKDMQTLHVLLIDGTVDAPKQVVHIQMFWSPRAGRTPFDPSATNATVRYFVFDGDQVGCFGGGGLLRPGDTPGDATFRGTLRNATLRLMHASKDFDNPLGSAVAAGSFTATRDDEKTLALVTKLQTLISGKLGYPVVVMNSAR